MDPSAPFLPQSTFAAVPTAPAFTAAPTAPTFAAVEPFVAPPAAANPTPPAPVAAAPNHPPYAEMICAAIAALKERDGSSKRAIAKYIDEAYSGLPPTHSALLTHHLKRLKSSGLVVMVKKSYKLPSSRSDNNGTTATTTATATANHVSDLAPTGAAPSGLKRGRGRPPKPKTESTAQLPPTQPASVPTQPVLVALGLADESADKKAPPGRPRKSVSMAVVQGSTELGKRRPGRPPKLNTIGSPAGDSGVLSKKRPGRPPGRKPKTINGPKIKRRPGRPAKAQSVPLIVPYSTADIPKPRGRPKAEAAAAATGNGIVKRRGRPSKVPGEVKTLKPKKATGKSPGRPKKNATVPTSEASAALEEVNRELKRKLDYFQSKVKQVVGVLKPQVTAQSSISTVTAIQELETLATMNTAAPLQEEVQVHVQFQVQPPMLQN